jgi:CHAT domain-containing protein
MLKRDFYKIPNLTAIACYLFFFLIFSALNTTSSASYSEFPTKEPTYQIEKNLPELRKPQNNPGIKILNSRLLKHLSSGEVVPARIIVDSVRLFLEQGIAADSSDLADASYLVGTYYVNYGNSNDAIFYLKKAADIFERTGRKSFANYSKCLYNTGVAYYNLGDNIRSINYILYSVGNEKDLLGENSVNLITGYNGISANYILMRDYEKSIEYINMALRIVQLNPDFAEPLIIANLYGTKGVAYVSLANYDQAKNNLEKAESYYNDLKYYGLNYVNILDNLATAYHYLGLKEKSHYYYEKGLSLLKNDISFTSFNLTKNYAIILGNDSLVQKGEVLLSNFLKRVQQSPGYDQRNYYLSLKNYADYLHEYKINENLAMKIYRQCFNYVNNHPWDKKYRSDIILGYSLSLIHTGEYLVALDSIQTLLFPEKSGERNRDLLKIPDPDSVKSDGMTIKILNTKYQILWNEFRKTNDITILEAAAKTSELIIAVLERIRINIGEEGSRLLLGDKYRDSYMEAISCLNECYRKTNNQYYLEKAFEYSEKSKVASLLASTREMKAIQNHIPSDLAIKEKDLQRNIGFYSSKIVEEENIEKPDREKISHWNDFILVASQQRDSLLKVFEKSYPDYYALKYDTKVISLGEIPELIGNGKNYLSYIVSDSLLYILVSNNKYRQLIAQKIDSSFVNTVAGFRKILITPDMDESSKNEFYKYQVYGQKLYSYLIKPVKKYLISDNHIISPDNILSYIPFESFITGDKINDDLIYRNLPYLMNDYGISYAYSATLLAEYKKAKPSFRNSTVIFAPSYESPVYIDPISNEMQSSGEFLKPLPFANEEAEFVSGLTHGSLYTDTTATESAFKEMAGNFDIIHLAMHTLINNRNPIFSKMIFSILKDTLDNVGLNISEIYGISLKAKLVVLSSCNTGSGNLLRGEGILSLARGFIYAGSKSVVMSLWEVDDKSGTDLIKSFYKNLKNGNTKSKALRKARLKYLKSAGQLRSHPYFWATLVIYGDDSPLYYSNAIKLIGALIPVILISGAILYRKKR